MDHAVNVGLNLVVYVGIGMVEVCGRQAKDGYDGCRGCRNLWKVEGRVGVEGAWRSGGNEEQGAVEESSIFCVAVGRVAAKMGQRGWGICWGSVD